LNQQAVEVAQSFREVDAMNVPAAKLMVLAVLSLTAGSLVVLFDASPSETDEPPRPVVSEADMEPVTEALVLRILAKFHIARSVIEGRFSLVQSAALFGALNQIPPQSLELSLLDSQTSKLCPRARTDEERLCRQVIDFVITELAGEPDRQEVAVALLKAEFRDQLHRESGIQLPDPSSLVSVEGLLEEAAAERADRRHRVTKLDPPESQGDGSGLITAEADGPSEWPAGQKRAVLGEHGGRVTCEAFSPDGQWLASGSHDRTVRHWNLAKVETRGPETR
jgi:hypothetical protein